MKKFMTELEKLDERDRKRMDRFDAVMTEYQRSRDKTCEDICEKIGCSLSSLWRWRHQVTGFRKAPFEAIVGCLRLANVSNVDLRYICGWVGDEN